MDDEVVRRLYEIEHLEQGEIAGRLGVSTRTVRRALGRLGLLVERTSHKDFLPWKIDPRHTHALPLQYIRALSKAAQTGEGDVEKLNTASRWAYNVLALGHDVDYDPDYAGTDVCPEGGFRLVPEPEGGGWLRDLRQAAKSGRNRAIGELVDPD
ncbi:hypothetical protein ABZV14_06025 [Streptosporangium canum]|uniref:hypothetical protein n=1 Tax=Streptosporangium canum TaxID=324952 RepID=UPI0033B37649